MHIVVHPNVKLVLDKVVSMLEGGLCEIDFRPVVVDSPASLDAGARAIVLGANHFSLSELMRLARNSIVLNVENVTSQFMTREYVAILQNFHVLDYSETNARALAELIGRPVRVMKFFYRDDLRRINHDQPKDIDLLFYGWMNERRLSVLQEIANRGVAVHAVSGVFGADLDALIERSKAVINIHYYENGSFEIVRVFDLLANGCAVVSELNDGEIVDLDLLDTIAFAPYSDLATAAETLVRDDGRCRALGAAGFRAISARSGGAILTGLLNECALSVLPSAANIGSGKSFDPDALNIDINDKFHPDIVASIVDDGIFNSSYQTHRFGEVRLIEGWFSSIKLTDVLEHITDLTSAMHNLLRLLSVGGELIIDVPYDLSYGAWQDPTHVRAFNERSWLYYSDWHWYLGWDVARFDLVELQFIPSPLGQELAQRGMSHEEIVRTPRAVDSMHVVLRKRLLTEAEQAYGRAMRGETRAAAGASA